MKRKILVLTATAMMLAMMMLGSALPALAQPPAPTCDWYLDYYYAQVFQQNWYGYWCYWPDEGWLLYGWWSARTGWISAY